MVRFGPCSCSLYKPSSSLKIANLIWRGFVYCTAALCPQSASSCGRHAKIEMPEVQFRVKMQYFMHIFMRNRTGFLKKPHVIRQSLRQLLLININQVHLTMEYRILVKHIRKSNGSPLLITALAILRICLTNFFLHNKKFRQKLLLHLHHGGHYTYTTVSIDRQSNRFSNLGDNEGESYNSCLCKNRLSRKDRNIVHERCQTTTRSNGSFWSEMKSRRRTVFN